MTQNKAQSEIRSSRGWAGRVVFILAVLSTVGIAWTRELVDVDVSQYKHWPKYERVPAGEIRPQEWRRSDDVIDGWDWSLPPSVKPSKRALLCVSRRANHVPKLSFPANPVVSLWVFWSDLEPEEDRYDFSKLLGQLKGIEEAGYGAIIRPMTACYSRPSYPDASKTPDWRKKPCAPPYLVTKYQVTQIEEKPKPQGWRIVNLDPAHPKFHERYCKFVRKLGEAGIPQMDVVKGFVVGYKSASWGDEGIGPHGERNADNEPTHVKERLDVWAEVCKGVEHKVCMGGASNYGFSKGFGIRRGFVEMYLYHIPDALIGQELDPKGYLTVNEAAIGVQPNRFHGEENEEFDERWTHRFGQLESFVYRYHVANLRLLQMRCNYLLNSPFAVYPDMLPFTALEMGRTVDDAPDVWCALRESYLRKGPAKNFERWLYQRDSKGFETVPAIKIDQAIKMWMVKPGKYHDYVARRGKRIAFKIDERFLKTSKRVAVKITYLDEKKGSLRLIAGKIQREVELLGSGQMRTATFFIAKLDGDAEHDLIIEGTPEAVVSFVRVIKVPLASDEMPP